MYREVRTVVNRLLRIDSLEASALERPLRKFLLVEPVWRNGRAYPERSRVRNSLGHLVFLQTRKFIGIARWPSSLVMLTGWAEPTPLFAHRVHPTPLKRKNQYLVLGLGEENAVQFRSVGVSHSQKPKESGDERPRQRASQRILSAFLPLSCPSKIEVGFRRHRVIIIFRIFLTRV